MKRIMIVEDDLVIQEKLVNLLQGNRYDVSYLDDFSSIIDDIKMSDPQLILLNMNLPNRSGYRICTKIRSFSNVPIIFVTSHETDMAELKSIMRSGDDYIMKPYSTIVLLTHINELMKNVNPTQFRKVLTQSSVS